MHRAALFSLALAMAAAPAVGIADAPPAKDVAPPPVAPSGHFKAEEKTSDGAVTVGGHRIDYQATAGTLVVHAKGWDDALPPPEKDDKGGGDAKEGDNATAEASMFFVAYVKHTPKPEPRPLTFLFNGGPGAGTVWLHMGAFGPKRVVTPGDEHPAGAPYTIVENGDSLLDASDLVFVDAPGTGFSRITGKDKEKAFYGVDADAHAFAEFIVAYLTKYGRWNSPKYLFGESYGTMRAAVLANELESERMIDVNGVILLSTILSYAASVDSPDLNPGVDFPYVIGLPSYAATAWYHKKLPDAPKELAPFLDEVEKFAQTDYLLALQAGSTLPAADRKTVVEKLHRYTGLPADYIEKANLRITGGEFAKTLQDDSDTTTGRLDARFSGPSVDPLSKGADYDPGLAALSSAYVAAFNDYVRHDLNYSETREYRALTSLGKWNHQREGDDGSSPQHGANVMPDLANAMIINPNLKILVNGGYFDLATPFFESQYEMHHLPIPAKLQANIDYHYYESGHMVYANEASLQALHDTVAAFIRKTSNIKPE